MKGSAIFFSVIILLLAIVIGFQVTTKIVEIDPTIIEKPSEYKQKATIFNLIPLVLMMCLKVH